MRYLSEVDASGVRPQEGARGRHEGTEGGIDSAYLTTWQHESARRTDGDWEMRLEEEMEWAWSRVSDLVGYFHFTAVGGEFDHLRAVRTVHGPEGNEAHLPPGPLNNLRGRPSCRPPLAVIAEVASLKTAGSIVGKQFLPPTRPNLVVDRVPTASRKRYLFPMPDPLPSPHPVLELPYPGAELWDDDRTNQPVVHHESSEAVEQPGANRGCHPSPSPGSRNSSARKRAAAASSDRSDIRTSPRGD